MNTDLSGFKADALVNFAKAEMNLTLNKKRAKNTLVAAIVDEAINQGVDLNQFDIASYGNKTATKPAAKTKIEAPVEDENPLGPEHLSGADYEEDEEGDWRETAEYAKLRKKLLSSEVEISIASEDGKAGKLSVPVAIQNRNWVIHRDKAVKVPYPVFRMLIGLQQENVEHDVDEDGKANITHIRTRRFSITVHSFPERELEYKLFNRNTA